MPAHQKKNIKNLEISPARAAWITLMSLVLLEVLFVIVDATINYDKWIDYGPFRRLCNIAYENGLAGWFMSAQTLITALVLWFIFWLSIRLEHERFYRIGWFILAAFFSFMSADDGAAIHERLGSTFELMMKDVSNSDGIIVRLFDIFPSYAWLLFVLPFFIAMGCFMLFFLWKVFGFGQYFLIILIAFTCFALAVTFDFFEGVDKNSPLNIHQWIMDNCGFSKYTVRHFAKSLEEFLEMLGMSLFLFIFIMHIEKMSEQPFVIKFLSKPKKSKK
ncbi:MAG: hypothetical protein L3J71_16220 [Victivallaceae bacterium]|nr:hypothetical protein [Victivallaceae bacterium]